MLALLRPDDWDFPLFLHVLGSIVLFGGVMSVVVLSAASLGRGPAQAAVLRRLAFATTVVVVWPAFVLMRAGAEWILSKEDVDETWVDIGMGISDAGILVLALITILAWVAFRRTRPDGAQPRAAPFVVGLSAIYLLALGVAVWAMTAKPG